MENLKDSLPTDTGISFAAHTVVTGILYLLLFHHSQTVLANLDLIPAAIRVAQAQTRIEDEWVLPNPNRKHPLPVKKAIPEKTLPEAPASPQNSWLPAAQTARQPRWVANLIDPDSYPSAARSLGGEGKVVVLVHVDTEGKVQEVRLFKGSNVEVLDQYAVEKVRNGIFTPAYNAQGSPVACEIILPILFRLAG
jgi:TonB family protein